MAQCGVLIYATDSPHAPEATAEDLAIGVAVAREVTGPFGISLV